MRRTGKVVSVRRQGGLFFVHFFQPSKSEGLRFYDGFIAFLARICTSKTNVYSKGVKRLALLFVNPTFAAASING